MWIILTGSCDKAEVMCHRWVVDQGVSNHRDDIEALLSREDELQMMKSWWELNNREKRPHQRTFLSESRAEVQDTDNVTCCDCFWQQFLILPSRARKGL